MMLGSSAHLAALRAPCSVVLIRSGCKVDSRLATVYMVAVDGSSHALHGLHLAAELARRGDEIVCRVFGPPEFTAEVDEFCTKYLQGVMHKKKVEQSVIETQLDDTDEAHGEEFQDLANSCRFRQQAFLVFGARGRGADGEERRIDTLLEGRAVTFAEMRAAHRPAGGLTEAQLHDHWAQLDAAEGSGSPVSPTLRGQQTTLGRVARWCIQ